MPIIFLNQSDNMGLDTSFVLIGCLDTELWWKIDFIIMAEANLHILHNDMHIINLQIF